MVKAPLPRIIGIVGPVRAGKTTVSRYLSVEYGYRLASNSELLEAILKILCISPSRKNLGSLGNALFETFGNDVIARARRAYLNEGKPVGKERLVVDGIRYIEEVEIYRSEPSFRLVAVTADLQDRFRRACISKSKDGDITLQSFAGQKNDRSERQVPRLMSLADATLHNTGSKSDILLKVDCMVEAWIRGHEQSPGDPP